MSAFAKRLSVLCLFAAGATACATDPEAMSGAAFGDAPSSRSRAADCDRECLEGFVDRYLAAVAADDPSAAPFAADVKYTEDGQRLELGDGLWNTMRGAGSYRLIVADPPAGQIALITTIVEGNTDPSVRVPAALDLRLKVEDGLITEVEQIVNRDDATALRIEAMGQPRPGLLAVVPEAERMSRADMIATANKYFSGLHQNDGYGDYPMADDCDRLENGNRATNVPTPAGETRPGPRTATSYSAQWTCLEQFESGLLRGDSRIRDRRFVAVDEERGLVAAFAFFDHEGGWREPYITRWGVSFAPNLTEPWTWEIMEIFKVQNGMIHEVEALFIRSPYGMPSGWSSYEDAMSDRIQDVTGYADE